MKKTNHLYMITLLQDFANLKKGDTMQISGIRAASLIKRGIAGAVVPVEDITIDEIVVDETPVGKVKSEKKKRK